ncbi:MAG TPA: response regulator [Gemmatimonadaceae bacterium]|nr:response regulator [Gemmatimonadaceae bacterium]
MLTKERRTILVLDDESALQLVLTRLLERAGFQVLTADTGSKALATLAAHSERIAMMIVDIKLPDMCGREFVHHAAARYGERPILYLSGVEPERRPESLYERTSFLAKPFDNAVLLSTISELLVESR